ncbi:MAG: 4-hydroxy-tetrahydrodipicolinate reductase [Clostridiales bacterium]|nr:4-hydroxy-tetrahydrodipicolinate reductase [Clostridiales bacterium]
MIKTAVCGVGRTGSEVLRAILDSEQFQLTAAFCSPGSEKTGRDVGDLLNRNNTGIIIREITQIEQTLGETLTDVVIDFSNPATTRALLRACKKNRAAAVLCTTGYTEAEQLWMNEFVRHNKSGVVFAPNVTLGVNVLLAALRLVARALPSFDYHITETHHSKKYDIPSGTAKKLAAAIEEELPEGAEVPISAIRAGGYVGLHTVMLASDYERLSLTHESFSRRAFVEGALVAAEFIAGKIGWYNMEDVLGMHVAPQTAADAV